eukprot:scaffold303635_cov50-Prasinocladus_malaysianus.AAC.1
MVVHPRLSDYNTFTPGATDSILYSKFEGSIDGITYTEILTVDAEPTQGYTSYYPPDDTPDYRYVRWVARGGYQCSLAELEFHGVLLSDASVDTACDVTLQIADDDSATATLANSFTYDSTLTPSVTSISPERGTSAGGTRVTITGTGFDTKADGSGTNTSDITVLLSGID